MNPGLFSVAMGFPHSFSGQTVNGIKIRKLKKSMKNKNRPKHLTVWITTWLLVIAAAVAFLAVVKNNKNETRSILSEFFRTIVFLDD
jgi:hypothetical protein